MDTVLFNVLPVLGFIYFLTNFVQFCNFILSLYQFSKIFGNILDTFELQKFQTHNTKAMVEDIKIQYCCYLSHTLWLSHRPPLLPPPTHIFDIIMDKLQLTGRALGRVFNFRSGCMHHTVHLRPIVAKQPNLELKTQPKQLLSSLLLVIALPDIIHRLYQTLYCKFCM